jgi:hypothetical protein
MASTCLEVKENKDSGESKAFVSERAVPQEKAAAGFKSSLIRMASLSYLSWQEEISLNQAGGGVYPLQASQMGICPGMSFSKVFKTRMRLELGGCFMIMSSQVAPTTAQAVVGANYQSSNSLVFGPMLRPGFFWSLEPGAVEFGMSIPISYRIGNWPDPSSSFSFNSKSELAVGGWVESRFYKKDWFFSPKIGIYKKTSSLFWSFEVGKTLTGY